MGSTSSRERQRSGEHIQPVSPSVQQQEGQAIDVVKAKFSYDQSLEDVDETGKILSVGSAPESDGQGDTIHQVQDKTNLPTVFKWDGGGRQVFISGSFNNWKTIPMVRSHGDFVTIVDLPEGDHQYKFYVDGQWTHNPTEPVIDNGFGSKNNVIKVKKTDFEVFDALATDIISSSSSQIMVTGSPMGDYGQVVPERGPNDKITNPPILPPHLLQVILNKDVPVSCEPTLLPEPNHVMLNHLYALSIKDGVMVLSATHRYSKKYVTTLLYKPI